MNLLDILYEFREDINWRRTLDEIANAVIDYNEAIADDDEFPREFLDGCLPAYWQIVREHNTRRWQGANHLPSNTQYDVGIFLVGFSSLPIVLSIVEIQPRQKIYFLHSPETERKCGEITNRIEDILIDPPNLFDPLIDPTDMGELINRVQNAERCQITNASDPVETFKQIKEVIDKVREEHGAKTKIALDLTGGKKTMIGGGFTAGSIYSVAPKCDMFYVDSQDYDPDLGTPKPGTEFLSRLDNPYDVYNVQSVREAEKLFNQHNYEAAAVLWEGVDEKLNDYAIRYELSDEQNSAQKYLFMADCYGCWDAFDYISANNSKKDNGNLWDYNTKHTYSSNTTNIDVLEVLSKVEDPKTLFDEEARIIHYTIDRYQNGVRRMESDRFDDAIVRFTQVVEILCRYHVYKIAVNECLTDERHDPVSSECCLDEEWSVTKLIHFLFKRHWQYDYRYHIGNEDWRLDIDKYGYENTMKVVKLIRPRNDFVHVKSNPKWEEMEDNAKDLQKLAQKFLENFSCDYRCETGLSFNELLELHRFRRIED